MATGTIKTWKGTFGFIVDEDGGDDIYFNLKTNPDLESQKNSLVHKKVVFEKRQSTRFPDDPNKFEAYNVRLQGTASQQSKESSDATRFHNPYTFVPTPLRPSNGFAGDLNPLKHDPALDHASLKDGLWTGHIPIKLTTVTPLVLLKTKSKDHPPDKPYEVFNHIPESSLRGMLRSAYEVVTNSRYGCFGNNHKEKLAYRMDTGEAPKLIPAIVKKSNGPGKLMAHLCTGTSIPTENGPKKGGSDNERAMYAAMLDQKLQYVNGGVPKTRDSVWAQIVLCKHDRPFYLYWKAIRVWETNKFPKKPTKTELADPTSVKWKSLYKNPNNPKVRIVKGHIFITNKNIKGKHDERIFFYDNPSMTQIEKNITDKRIEEDWEKLIKNYREAHPNDEIFNREDEDGNSKEPWHWFKKNRNTTEWAWSPHLYHNGKHKDRWCRDVHDALELQPGDMVYARCKFDSNGKIEKIEDLFPVMISRELYEKSPEDLLDSSLQPAEDLSKLSPADRLFGWTPQGQGGEGGYKSRLRVVCKDNTKSDTIESFNDDALPLAILGQPKPAQGRFYVAKDKEGTPQNDGTSKEGAGYSGNKGLRGRKQYWHHKGLEANKAGAYWHPSAKDRTREKHDDRYQEYRRPNEDGKKDGKPKQDSQNRFIKKWIKPDIVFKASLYVQNLQPEELGALLWLLTLNDKIGDGDEKCYFRLGYGKPLGFGSVKIEIDEDQCLDKKLPLGTGQHWKEYYGNFNAPAAPTELNQDLREKYIKKFQDNMRAAYSSQDHYETGQERRFNNLRFISGFLRVLRGPKKDAPIHYPRRTNKPEPDGKNYAWFVTNERGRSRREAGGDEVGKKLALPAVTNKNGLPYTPSRPKN